jgi:uncharacterized phage-associated protein
MSRNDAYDPRAIANKILDIRSENGGTLSIMQLIKLVYIADGWSLALRDKPLCRESAQAWQYGPVFRSVYNSFSGIGSRPVTGRAMVTGTEIPISAEFSDDEEKLIRMVVSAYGKLSAFTLSNLTHQPNTPWSLARERGLYSDLNDQEIIDHFNMLKAKRFVTNAT